ncbi:MAG: class I SAM-dependent methyltransferase [bacterium]|nr:class I SAM-dependent methyltransferase [bacterium]
MVFNNPQPDPGELLDTYKEVEDPLYLEETKARERTFKHSLKQLHRYTGAPGKLLDVGCYTGAFMEVAKAGGWEVSGLELSTWAAGIARGLQLGEVYEVPLDSLPVEPASFDVLSFWDVMEHLSEPKAFLRDAAGMLKEGGVLAFSTHMVDSMAVRVMGTRYPFFMDMHIVHFSRATIKRILEAEGFELLRILPHRRVLRFGYFLEKLEAKVPVGRSLIRWMAGKPWIADRFIRIGFLGLVNIYARKKEI